jgi:hypothetical protein
MPADVIHRTNVGMTEPCDGCGFAFKAGAQSWRIHEAGPEDHDSHIRASRGSRAR